MSPGCDQETAGLDLGKRDTRERSLCARGVRRGRAARAPRPPLALRTPFFLEPPRWLRHPAAASSGSGSSARLARLHYCPQQPLGKPGRAPRAFAVAGDSEDAVLLGGRRTVAGATTRAHARACRRARPRTRGPPVWSSRAPRSRGCAGAGPDALLHVSAPNLVICRGGLRGSGSCASKAAPPSASIMGVYGTEYLSHQGPRPPWRAAAAPRARAGGGGGRLGVSLLPLAHYGIREDFYSSFYEDER